MEKHLAGPLQRQRLFPEEDTALRCQYCDFSTSQTTTLRKHYAVQHDIHFFRTQHVNPTDHMLHGLPGYHNADTVINFLPHGEVTQFTLSMDARYF